MKYKIVKLMTVDSEDDFRARATLGVALSALTLLLPFAITSLCVGDLAIAVGTLGIVAMLAINAVSVIMQYEYQIVTLYGLVPAGMVFMTQVFQQNGFIGTLWCFPAVLGCYCMLSEARARIANIMILLVALPMAFHTLEPYLAARVMATLLAVSLFATIVVRVIDEQQSLLRRQALCDPLTGLLNRTSLPATLEQEITHAVSRPACLLALDLDHFKRINDTHGHERGDAVLCGVSEILMAQTEEGSSIFRPGGEEFLVLLPDCSWVEASQVAERVRRSIAHAPLLPDQSVMTVSIGVAAVCTGDDWMSWMRASDAQLYAAKSKGRDCVVVADRSTGSDRSAASSKRASSARQAELVAKLDTLPP